MDLPGDKHKSNPKNVTHEAFIKSLQSQRRVLGRVIKNEEQLKEIVDQLVAMGATLGEHGEIFDSHGIRIRKLDDKVTGLQKRVSKVEKRKPQRGPRGKTGRAGRDGRDGIDGSDGTPGSGGAQGQRGAQGDSGASGGTGPSGSDGVDGSDGFDGSDGSQGGTGPSGARGADGQGPDKSQNPDFDWDTPGGGSPSGGRTYEGTREDDLVDEEIDERILRIIGLDDTIGIDYATYRTLLREKMAEGRMGTTTMSSEEVELITEEWKRVKGKVGRFKVKKGGDGAEDGAPGPTGGVNPDSFFNKKPPGDAAGVTPEGGEEESSGGMGSIAEIISSIRATVESIAEIVKNQSRLIMNDINRRARNDQKGRRAGAEAGMEKKKGSGIAGAAAKALKPVMGVWEMLVNFFKQIIMGRILFKLIDWFGNPSNQGKVQALTRFIGAFWPALLAGFLMFATPLGGVIKFVVGSLVKLTGFMLKKAIPMALKAIAANPWTAGALAVGGLAAYGLSQMGGEEGKEGNDKYSKEDSARLMDIESQMESLENSGIFPGDPEYEELVAEQNNIIGKYSGGGQIVPLTQAIPLLNQGGEITPQTGERIKGAEPDTQLVAAQPGEVMMSKDAVQKYGADTLLGMNAAAGGSNVPEMAEGIQKMSGGGLVGTTNTPEAKPPIEVDLGGKQSEEVDLTPPKDGADGADGAPGADGADGATGQTGAQGLAGGMLSGIGSGLKTMGGIAANVMDPFGIGRGLLGKAKDAIGGVVGGITDKLAGPKVTVAANLVPSTLPVLEERIAKLEFEAANPPPAPEPPTANVDSVTMPPQSNTNEVGGAGGGETPGLPEFPAFKDTPQRKNNIELYGIVGVK